MSTMSAKDHIQKKSNCEYIIFNAKNLIAHLNNQE